MKKLAITVAVTTALLFTLEASLRLWAYYFRHSYQHYDVNARMIRLVPGYDEIRGGGRIRINSKGFRGPEFSEHKVPGAYRIFVLGDSATFGLAGEGCPYPAKLEKLLNHSATGRRFQVINAGVEGYNSRDALWLLEREVLRYEPDMITIYIGWNDLMQHDPGRPDASESVARISYALYDIYLVKFWRKVIFSALRPMVLHVQTDLPEEKARMYQHYVPYVFKHNLQRMVTLANHHNIKVVLITLPSPLNAHMPSRDIKKLYFPYYTYNLKMLYLVYSRYNQTIREVGRENALPILDLETALSGKSAMFFDTSHMYCEGHGVVAEQLLELLQNIGVRGRHP